ncbi:UNVERIFIED_CONTAM: hypothetical protein RMT77_008215 [Armadillidium vulgare]
MRDSLIFLWMVNLIINNHTLTLMDKENLIRVKKGENNSSDTEENPEQGIWNLPERVKNLLLQFDEEIGWYHQNASGKFSFNCSAVPYPIEIGTQVCCCDSVRSGTLPLCHICIYIRNLM